MPWPAPTPTASTTQPGHQLERGGHQSHRQPRLVQLRSHRRRPAAGDIRHLVRRGEIHELAHRRKHGDRGLHDYQRRQQSGTVTVPTPAQRSAWSHSSSAVWYLPDENEWYKAAYYDPSLTGANKYWLYPTRSNTPPSSDPPPGGTNSANYFGPNGYVLTQSTTNSSTQNYLTDVARISIPRAPMARSTRAAMCFSGTTLIRVFASSVRGYRGGDFSATRTTLTRPSVFTVLRCSPTTPPASVWQEIRRCLNLRPRFYC